MKDLKLPFGAAFFFGGSSVYITLFALTFAYSVFWSISPSLLSSLWAEVAPKLYLIFLTRASVMQASMFSLVPSFVLSSFKISVHALTHRGFLLSITSTRAQTRFIATGSSGFQKASGIPFTYWLKGPSENSSTFKFFEETPCSRIAYPKAGTNAVLQALLSAFLARLDINTLS